MATLADLLNRDENDSLEFKSSLRYDIQNQRVNKELQKVVAKTIAGFMNSNGGILLIGVADNKEILGIEKDLSCLSNSTNDGFELALRNCLACHLGAEVSSNVKIAFERLGRATIARVECSAGRRPTFFKDGDRHEFYIRDGNLTRPLHVQAAHQYIGDKFPNNGSVSDLRDALREVIREEIEQAIKPPPPPPKREEPRGWVKLSTRRVIDTYMAEVLQVIGWKKLFIISPWISDFGDGSCPGLHRLLARAKDDKATLYVVTRPPEHDWHKNAVTLISASDRANVCLVPDLHVKLYTLAGDSRNLAMLASANMTRQARENREIGLMVDGRTSGRDVFSKLQAEATEIYHHPRRKLVSRARLS